ncbi:hypothetical protein WICPIJ_005559 [Wickerhamomyces pijperi]|uniref:Uncharacterized protein n=1 Tax=Wickerhamomyces pijperi TaxID=599730 RepID=A0A9P8Q5G0_WICPI|nr:hypothetical protein WICPIJ_005559 [Wickerhamomyces pijperi]
MTPVSENQSPSPGKAISPIDDDLPVSRLFTPLLSKKVPSIPDINERRKWPYMTSNWVSKIFLFWLVGMYNVGYKRTLTVNDLWEIPDELKIENIFPLYQETLANQKKPKKNILRATLKTLQSDFVISLTLRSVSNVAQIVSPLLVKKLITIVQTRREGNKSVDHLNAGIGYSIGIALLLIVNTLTQQHAMYYGKLVGAKARTLLTKHILSKSMRQTSSTASKFPKGKLIALMSTDIAKMEMGLTFLPTLLTIPVPIIIGIALLIVNLGVSALTGIATIFIILAISVAPAVKFVKNRALSAPFTDSRITLIREVLQSLKFVKFYTWEEPYAEKITEIRSQESKFIWKAQNNINLILSLVVGVPSLASMVTFLTLYGIYNSKSGVNHRSVAEIFSSLSLFGVISGFITNIPMLLSNVLGALVSLNRISEYLNDDEEGDSQHGQSLYLTEKESQVAAAAAADAAVSIVNGTFQWDELTARESDSLDLKNDTSSSIGQQPASNSSTILQNIDLTVPKGSFTVVIGPIGSGKSSLLSAINGDLHSDQPCLSVSGSKILCTAVGDPAWVQNATIRDNILFGSPYDEEFYQDVVTACCLDDDIKFLFKPNGDLTEIGERGVTLSGGQKARINLARAVYHHGNGSGAREGRFDIYLLDDVLNAVDSKVGKEVVDRLMFGLLKGRTRIMATHQLNMVELADQIIFMNGDGTVDVASSKEELYQRNERFRKFIAVGYTGHDSAEQDEDDEIDKSQESETNRKREQDQTDEDDSNGMDLYDNEEVAVNSIPFSLYVKYFQAGQGPFGVSIHFVLLFSITFTAFCYVFTNVWLTFWVERRFGDSFSDGKYIGIYVMVVVMFFVGLFAEVGVLGFIIVESSRALNIKAINRIFHVPMSYMDTTPLGRILNRFSKDTNSMDNELAEQLKFFIHGVSISIAIIIVTIIYLPWFAIAVPVMFALLFATGNYYQSSSREVKRLEAITRSFLYNQFNEVLSGLSTIKNYKQEPRFLSLTDTLLDNLNEVYIVTVGNQRWVQIVIDTMSSLMVIVIALLSLTGQFNISAASTGLVCTMFIELSFLLSFAMNAYTELENEMNSVERVSHYAFNLEQEEDPEEIKDKPPQNWPENGMIKFETVSMRYRPELPLVLQDFSLSIAAGEKIGICGRTGAGKSTLMTVLYRLTDIAGGKVTIDDVDISKMSLFDLRSQLAIIPQDPVLFQGTLRKNLDPFDQMTDTVLNDALLRSGLISATSASNKFSLDMPVEDSGTNFSLGERQLIALTRAILKKSKILIMDEATSNMDYTTDALIQETLHREFKECTTLCIAHRLKTILHYDKILVMEKGQLGQFGTPLDLFVDQNSAFRSLCDASKITEEDIRSAEMS